MVYRTLVSVLFLAAQAIAAPSVTGSNTNVAKKTAGATAAVSEFSLPVGISAKAPNDHSVLILSTTNGNEATTAAGLGLTPVVVTPAQWAALTPTEFASYRAIILGDNFCTSVDAVAAAEANVNVWSPIVKGNVIVDGTDPSFHIQFGFNNAGAQNYQQRAIAYAADQKALTGAYISLSCYYEFAAPGAVKVLSGFGNFQAAAVQTCDGNQRVVAPQTGNPLSTLTNADLQGWLCSSHELFTKFPSTFTKFAVLDDLSGNNKPYILVRSANCCLGTYTGSACCGGQSGNDVFTCSSQKAIKINTCVSPVPHCQNVALGVVGGLSVQSAVCNI